MVEFEKISKDSGIGVPVLKKMHESILQRVKKDNSSISDADAQTSAEQELIARTRRAAFRASNKDDYTGLVIGASNPRDMSEMRRRKAERAMLYDKAKAIEDKLVNNSGEVLNNFGKVIGPDEHNWLRTAYVIAKKEGDADPKLYSMSLGVQDITQELPTGVPVKFKASVREQDGSLRGDIRSFEAVEGANVPPLEKLVDTYMKDNFVEFNELRDWHEQHQADFNRVFLTKAVIMNANENVIAKNNTKMLNLCSLDYSEQAFCWASGDLKLYPAQSEVYAIGSTSLSQDKQLQLNLFGLIPLKVAEVNAESLGESGIEASAPAPSDKKEGSEWVM